MKNLLKTEGSKKLSKTEQKSINGGGEWWYDALLIPCDEGCPPSMPSCLNGFCSDYNIR
ncbi:hypothetical protein [Psychroserpens luteolus]|uniref:hypothetical protein n=1 Tax=Psychroserpens luteolus TaxID=2855840 RepID=UPI001E28311A|nr:hypothetical protein [Psychroserpens luteolus]MCD2258645.1 hypothetical protein [Psychroserpens luteolus]